MTQDRLEWFREATYGMFIHWGYNKNDHDWKDAKTVIRNLVAARSKGGNYLLNEARTPLKTDVYRRSALIHLPDEPQDVLNSVVVVEYS